MKFTVHMKDPDTLDDSINDAVAAEVKALGITDKNEVDALREVRSNKVRALCGMWFEYGEYLHVEIDTEAKTCRVLTKKEADHA
jgi:hypothetical protein